MFYSMVFHQEMSWRVNKWHSLGRVGGFFHAVGRVNPPFPSPSPMCESGSFDRVGQCCQTLSTIANLGERERELGIPGLVPPILALNSLPLVVACQV